MKANVLLLVGDTEVVAGLKNELGGDDFDLTTGDPADAEPVLGEGPWDVVVFDGSDHETAESVLALVLTEDLFSQVIFYIDKCPVREAVRFMRMGAWSVLVRSESGVEELAEAVRESWSERLADLELAREHGID